MKRLIVWILALLLLASSIPAAADGDAVDLSKYLRFEQNGRSGTRSKLLDNGYDDPLECIAHTVLTVSWPDVRTRPHTLYIQWNVPAEQVTARQLDAAGRVLTEQLIDGEYDTPLALHEKAEKVTFLADRYGMSFIRFGLFGGGETLPEPFLCWEETPRGLDYLLIATHPDDDVLFMGCIPPVYGAERGYTGTVAYLTTPTRGRVNEAMLCDRVMGLTLCPIFLNFRDVSSVKQDRYKSWFLPEAVTLALVRLLREYRPLVVFTQDQNGEYGHWQHVIVSASVADAVRLAADPEFDTPSVERFGAWQVQKCYVHLYEENPLTVDIRAPLAAFGGKDALTVAQEAFKKHRSQQSGRHTVQSDTDKHPMNRFGMIYGVVEAGNDVFDNIDPALLHGGPAR